MTLDTAQHTATEFIFERGQWLYGSIQIWQASIAQYSPDIRLVRAQTITVTHTGAQ